MKKRASLALRLSIIFSILIAIFVLGFSTLTVFILRYQLRSQQDKELIEAAQRIQSTYLESNQVMALFETQLDIPWYILFVIYETDSVPNATLSSAQGEGVNVLLTNDRFIPILQQTNGKTLLHHEDDYFLDGDLNILYYTLANDDFIIQTALNMDLDTTSELLDVLPLVFALIALPLVIISFALARFITTRTLHPVALMTESAKKIGFTSLDQRLPVSGTGDELDTLAVTFNELFERLKNDFMREKQFTADVSHELKTPLSVILGHANLLRRWGKDDVTQLEKSIEALITESHHMEHIIQNLLQLSRLEQNNPKSVQIECKTILLHDFFVALSKETTTWAESADIHIDCSENITVYTDENMLHQVLTILVANSVRYSSPSANILLTAQATSDSIKISVSDKGQGISPKDLPYVFERFYRADVARRRLAKDTKTPHNSSGDGSGLGLAIAYALVTVLGGNISVESPNPASNCGTVVSIRL